MDVKIKHVYGDSEDAAQAYYPQHPRAKDGDDGRVITATIRNAPSVADAVRAANESIFVSRLHSCDYSELGAGRIVRGR